MLAALRLPALAAFGAFTVSAALDGIAALLPPEVRVEAPAPGEGWPRVAGRGDADHDPMRDPTPPN